MPTDLVDETASDIIEGVDDPSELEDADAPSHVRYSIKSYGADYPVDALVKRLQNDSIIIPTFQRGYVWTLPQASRFMESLLLGLPIPAIFLSREPNTQQLLVIDGQQRLQSLRFFYDGFFKGREFGLRGVQQEFEGVTYKSLPAEDKRRLDDGILHAIVVAQEGPADDDSGMYNLFERINTGGTPLHPQEIRTCIYPGPFIQLLKELALNESWRELYGAVSPRGKDQELILRFFALYFNLTNYQRPLKQFLNDFMSKNRAFRLVGESTLKKTFVDSVSFSIEQLGAKAFRPVRNLNSALMEAILIGTGKRLEAKPIRNKGKYKYAYRNLMANTDFVASFNGATTDVEKLRLRISTAIDAFAKVP
jgi:hypothetical protein